MENSKQLLQDITKILTESSSTSTFDVEYPWGQNFMEEVLDHLKYFGWFAAPDPTWEDSDGCGLVAARSATNLSKALEMIEEHDEEIDDESELDDALDALGVKIIAGDWKDEPKDFVEQFKKDFKLSMTVTEKGSGNQTIFTVSISK